MRSVSLEMLTDEWVLHRKLREAGIPSRAFDGTTWHHERKAHVRSLIRLHKAEEKFRDYFLRAYGEEL